MMPNPFQESYIRQVPMFRALSQEQFNWLVQAFQVQHYPAGAWLFQQGARTTGLHIFVQGQAAFLQSSVTGHPQQTQVVQEGTFINQDALLREGTESASLQALQALTVLFLSRVAFQRVMAQHPELAYALGLATQPPAPRPAPMQRFPKQGKDEQILLEMRRHWWAYIRWFWLPIMVMFGLWVFANFVQEWAWILVALSFFLPILLVVYFYLEWANDRLIITGHRLIFISQSLFGLANQQEEILLATVQTVIPSLPTVMGRVLNYGTLDIRTSRKNKSLHLNFMPDPLALQTVLLEAVRQANSAQINTPKPQKKAKATWSVENVPYMANYPSQPSHSTKPLYPSAPPPVQGNQDYPPNLPRESSRPPKFPRQRPRGE